MHIFIIETTVLALCHTDMLCSAVGKVSVVPPEGGTLGAETCRSDTVSVHWC